MKTAIFIALPLLCAACSLLKKKWLFCAANGVLLFVCTLLCLNTAAFDGTDALPVGFSFFKQLLTLLFPDSDAASAVVSAILAVSVSAALYSHSAEPRYSAFLFVSCGFWLYFIHEPIVFIAAALCACALKYASQRDFLRFAALVLLGACFCPEMWAVLLLFPFFAAPVGLPLLLAGIAAGAALLLINPADFLFQSMSAPARIFPQNGVSALVPVALFLLLLIASLARKMFRKNRRDCSDTMLTALFAAAVLSLMSVSDTRCLPLTAALAAPAAFFLGGELFLTGKRLIAMTFQEKSRGFLISAAAIAAAVPLIWYFALLVRTGVIE